MEVSGFIQPGVIGSCIIFGTSECLFKFHDGVKVNFMKVYEIYYTISGLVYERNNLSIPEIKTQHS